MDNQVTLHEGHLQSLKLAKVFRDHTGPIQSFDFDENGLVCATASTEDDIIRVYDTINGKPKQVCPSKKYGVGMIRFTHRSQDLLHTSIKTDHTIRYLSLHQSTYLQYFSGHKRPVTSIEMSPNDDRFISGSLDDSVRLWDLRSHHCQATMNLTGSPVVAFDPQGLLFAIGLNSKYLKMYDSRAYTKGPFESWTIVDPFTRTSVDWTRLQFSNDGLHILISTRQEVHYLIDSYEGTLVQSYQGHTNKAGLNLEAALTPDSKFVLSGSQTGKIHIWERLSGKEVQVLEGHSKPVSHVQFNPKYCMMASTCSHLVSE